MDTRDKAPHCYLFVYGALMRQRWEHFYHLIPVGYASVAGDVRAYRNDRAAQFDKDGPVLIHGAIVACPDEATLHKLDMMEAPQYRRVRLVGSKSADTPYTNLYAYEYAGSNFPALPKLR